MSCYLDSTSMKAIQKYICKALVKELEKGLAHRATGTHYIPAEQIEIPTTSKPA